MAYDNAMEEDLELGFLLEDVLEDRDEVDSVSKHVINFESGAALPKYSVNPDSENRGIKKEAKRLRTVSEKTLKKFDRGASRLQDGVDALLTFRNALDEEQVKKLPSFLRDFCEDVVFHVLYHSSNHVVLRMHATSYTFLGDRIVAGNGFKIQNLVITHLEAMCLNPVPSCFVELSTPKSAGEVIQREFSGALVTFCGSFQYLRLYEDEQPDLRPTDPSVSLTLLFSKRAQGNAEKLHATLSNEYAPWMKYEPPKVVRVPFEQLFVFESHSTPPLGLIGGNDIPGVRISVRFSTKQQEMLEFYRVLTGKNPVCRSDREETSYMIYPIARNLELQLIYNSSIRTDPTSGVAICVRIADHEKMSAALQRPLKIIDAGHWETCDPVGNKVKLFTPFQ